MRPTHETEKPLPNSDLNCNSITTATMIDAPFVYLDFGGLPWVTIGQVRVRDIGGRFKL